MTANNLNDDWWKQAVVYQIYPRSFKDVNGDGLGDIAGVTEKMDYLKNLGELPPNDWQSFFGGPAWARVPDGQWYLHLFDKAQPDVNWKNPDIHEEFKKTLRFWSDHGTDGFRIDVAHGLAKDLESKPLEELGREYSVVGVLNHDFSHPLFDRREVHDIYRRVPQGHRRRAQGGGRNRRLHHHVGHEQS